MSGKKMRERFAQGSLLVLPGAYDALSARLVEDAGFEAVYATGAGMANSQYGLPDLGLTSFGEVIDCLQRMAEAVGIPLVADGDTGYGNALNVQRTVKAYGRAGIAAIQLEDQTFPKRCGHFDDKRVIGAAEMVAKIKAAVDAAAAFDMVVIARTDARAVLGLEAALERAALYHEAGAEVTFVEAPLTVEEIAEIGRRLPWPQVLNIVEGGKTPVVSAAEAEAMGFAILLHANAAMRTGLFAIQGLLRHLRETGSTRGCENRMITSAERNRLTRLPQYLEQSALYTSEEE